MSLFIVLDLGSQANAVARYIQGWEKERILAWLSQQGEVRQISHPQDRNLYGFRSHVGITTGFRLLEDGQIIIIHDHTTYVPLL